MIGLGTVLSFGKYKGKLVQGYPSGQVPFEYLIWLRDKTTYTLSEELLSVLKHQENEKKLSNIPNEDYTSSDWSPNLCSRCGTYHTMSCDYS